MLDTFNQRIWYVFHINGKTRILRVIQSVSYLNWYLNIVSISGSWSCYWGFGGGSDSKESILNAGDPVWSLDREDPLEMEWLPASVFLPGESHGQRNLVGYSPWDRKESDTTDQLTLSLSKLLLFEKPPVRNISCLWSRKHLLRTFYLLGLCYIT